jgi:UTP--glucose-1-phosphate uridylyltransferase
MDHLSRHERGTGNEIQLTDAMARLVGQQPFHGLHFEGTRFDCGGKVGFLEATIAHALTRPDMADNVRRVLKKYSS